MLRNLASARGSNPGGTSRIGGRSWIVTAAAGLTLLDAFAASAQTSAGSQQTTPTQPAAAVDPAAETALQQIAQLKHQVDDLTVLVHKLQDQLAKAPQSQASAHSPIAQGPAAQGPVAQTAAIAAAPPGAASPAPSGPQPVATASAAQTPAPAGAPAKVTADLLRGVTINALLDSYYEYNTDNPMGRANLLRAYDVSSNSFSLNQADIVIESAPDLSTGKRWGLRLDLQFGQATSTLQGNPANELRPDIYRNIFQAYGTYIVPVGSGLSLDFGKWASSLGYEGNYTKDQLNYSRSFLFDFLPFYHTGLRARYAVNDQVAVNFWIVNGTEETEADNNFKDVLVGLVLTPTSTVTWTTNYYLGQEHPDVIFIQNPTPAQMNLPNQQGTYFQPIVDPPTGKLNILDSYINWQPLPPLTLAAEIDYVEERLYNSSPSQEDWGAALYAAYQINPQWSLAVRGEYLSDHGAMFTGVRQSLSEGTLTVNYRPTDGFSLYGEFRRDHSSQPFFLGPKLGILQTAQPTIGIGAVWWLGQKQGAW